MLTYAALLVPSLTQQYFTGCTSVEPLEMHCTLDNLCIFLEGSRILDLRSDLWIKRKNTVCYQPTVCLQTITLQINRSYPFSPVFMFHYGINSQMFLHNNVYTTGKHHLNILETISVSFNTVDNSLNVF